MFHMNDMTSENLMAKFVGFYSKTSSDPTSMSMQDLKNET